VARYGKKFRHCEKISMAFVRGDVLKQSALSIATFFKFKK
jgi:hypothetical protein